LSGPELPTADLFRRACGQFATGVAILTTVDEAGAPHGLTINSFTSLSLDPPLVMAAIASASNLVGIFESASHYAVNILAAAQQPLSDRFARRRDHRFQDVDWVPGAGKVPLLQGSVAVLECRRSGVVEVGDHKIFIGHVEAVRLGDTTAAPLLYFRGGYAQLF
jgi:flavin reductase (DIM6/NTAB) family NADH-FMN oxidoreductase RutF